MKTQNQNTIKIVSILTILICLQVNFLFAASIAASDHKTSNSKCKSCEDAVLITLLTPNTPSEAIFEDGSFVIETNLAPITPAVASFEDDSELNVILNAGQIAPSTPWEASFEDEPASMPDFLTANLAPVAPESADFNE